MQHSWTELESGPVAYARLSPEGQFLQVNQAACELFGYSCEALLGMTARDLTHPEDRAQSVALVDRAVRHKEERHQVIKRYLHSQGHVFWALLTTNLERDNQNIPLAFLSKIEDITQQVESNDVLRAFVRRLQTIKEQERQAIARELHEELAQTFAGLKLEIDRLKPYLPVEARGQVARMSSMVDHTLTSLRRFTATMRPPILDDLGLESAIEWMLREFIEGAGLSWEFPRDKTPLSLDWETRIALFRIAQEAINNVVSHAQAKRVKIALFQDGDAIVFRLGDDGVGLDPSASSSKGMGFYIMRERAEMLGGSVRLGANTPKGTLVEVRLRAPLEKTHSRELRSHWE